MYSCMPRTQPLRYSISRSLTYNSDSRLDCRWLPQLVSRLVRIWLGAYRRRHIDRRFSSQEQERASVIWWQTDRKMSDSNESEKINQFPTFVDSCSSNASAVSERKRWSKFFIVTQEAFSLNVLWPGLFLAKRKYISLEKGKSGFSASHRFLRFSTHSRCCSERLAIWSSIERCPLR